MTKNSHLCAFLMLYLNSEPFLDILIKPTALPIPRPHLSQLLQRCSFTTQSLCFQEVVCMFFFPGWFGDNHSPNSFYWSLQRLFFFCMSLVISQWVCNMRHHLSRRENEAQQKSFFVVLHLNRQLTQTGTLPTLCTFLKSLLALWLSLGEMMISNL